MRYLKGGQKWPPFFISRAYSVGKIHPYPSLSTARRVNIWMKSLKSLFLAFLLVGCVAQKAPLSEQELDNKMNETLSFTVTAVCVGDVHCGLGVQALTDAETFIESRLSVKFSSLKVITAEAPTGSLEERWEKLAQFAVRMGTDKTDLTIIMTEDFPDNVDTFDMEEEGVLGLSSGIGVLGIQPSLIFAKVTGSHKFEQKLLEHEIGHCLGAEHVMEGIMAPAMSLGQYSDDYSVYSLEQMKAHLEQVRELRALDALVESVKEVQVAKIASDHFKTMLFL